MSALLSIVLILATLLLPGWALLQVVHPHRLATRWLTAPIAAMGTMLLLMPVTALVLSTPLSGRWLSILLALTTLVLLALAGRRFRAERAARTHAPSPPTTTPTDARERTWSIITWCTIVGGVVLGWTVRASLFSDTLYHAAQARKLVALDDPNWSNTLQFVDGSSHPGYLLPIFQSWLGIASGPFDVLFTTQRLPIVLVPLLVMAAAALGRLLTRSHRGAALAALGTLAVGLAPAPRFPIASFAAYGGAFVLTIVFPVLLASIVIIRRGHAVDGAPRAHRFYLILIAVGTLLTGVLHASYLVLLAMPMLAIVLGWVWIQRTDRPTTRRIAAALATVAVAAVVITASLAPALAGLESFLQDGDRVAQRGVEGDVERPSAEATARIFVGDGATYHLRSDVLVAEGGVPLVLLIASVIAGAFFWRRTLGWLTLGTTAVVLLFTQWDAAFAAVVGATGADQARRLGDVLPLAFGLVVLGEVIAHLLGRGRRVLAGVVSVSLAAASIVAVSLVPKLAERSDDPVLEEWPVRLLTLVAVLLVGAFTVRGIVRAVRRTASGDPAAAPVAAAPVWLAVLAPLLPALALLGAALTVAWPDLQERRDDHKVGLRTGEFAFFRDVDLAGIRDIPTGAIVLTDGAGQARTAFRVLALVPAYVIAGPPGHVANTKQNDIPGRLEQLDELLASNIDATERARRLDDAKVDAIVVERHESAESLRADLQGPLASTWCEHPGAVRIEVYRRC